MTEAEHEAALLRIGELLSAKPDTAEFSELDALVTLVDAYEEKYVLRATETVEASVADVGLPTHRCHRDSFASAASMASARSPSSMFHRPS